MNKITKKHSVGKSCSSFTVHGNDCKRPAVKDSDFCYFHKNQEEDSEIKGKINDIYMCPNSCEELNYWHRYGKPCYTCSECNGVLLNEKHNFKDLILKLPKSDNLSLTQLGCPTCSSSDYSDSNSYPLSVFVYRWLDVTRTKYIDFKKLKESNIYFCNTCESIWIPKFRTVSAEYWPSEKLLSVENQNHLLERKEKKSQAKDKQNEQRRIIEDERMIKKSRNCIFIDSKGKPCLRPKISGGNHCFLHKNVVKDEEQEIVEKPAFGSKLWFTGNMPLAALILWLGIVFTFDLNTRLIDFVGSDSSYNSGPIGVAAIYAIFFIWPLFVNYKKLIEKI